MRCLRLAGLLLTLACAAAPAAGAAEPVVTTIPTGRTAAGPITGTSGAGLAILGRQPDSLVLLDVATLTPSLFDVSYPHVPANDLTSGPDGKLWLARTKEIVGQPVFPFSSGASRSSPSAAARAGWRSSTSRRGRTGRSGSSQTAPSASASQAAPTAKG